MEQKLERLEKIRKITGEQRALKKRIGEERASQNLQKNAIDFLKRHEDLVTEIQNKKINIFQNKKKFENITKKKNEMNNLKYLIKMDSISDLRRKEEYIRMVKYYELLEKQSKTEQIKNDRINVKKCDNPKIERRESKRLEKLIGNMSNELEKAKKKVDNLKIRKSEQFSFEDFRDSKMLYNDKVNKIYSDTINETREDSNLKETQNSTNFQNTTFEDDDEDEKENTFDNVDVDEEIL